MPPGNRQQEKMTKPAPVALWFLLSSLLLSVCLCSAPSLSTIHEINTRGRQREQVINREGEYIDKRGRRFSEDTGGEVDAVPLSALYYLMWRDREDGSDFLKRGHSLSGPHPQLPTTPVSGKEVDVKEDANNISATPALTPNTTSTATKTSNITITTATTTTTTSYPVVHTALYPPPSSSSCSSPACKWLASWHFIVVVCMTVTWLVALMILYWMTRTARGRRLLETWSSPCIHDKKDQEEDQVLGKGIGYFDGSPGMRRFVLFEDDDDDEEEDNEDDLYAPEFQDEKNKEYKETERGEGREDENRTSKKWKPPRKGTYILQEASVLEVGTYRLQEEEEEEEVNDQRKRKKEDREEEVEYILEGEAYILQSERVGRGGIGGEGYGQIRGIEGLYGIVGRERLRGGYRRIGGLERVYRIMGRGEVREQGRYGGLGRNRRIVWDITRRNRRRGDTGE